MRKTWPTLLLLSLVTAIGMLLAVAFWQPDLATMPEFTPGDGRVERGDAGVEVRLGVAPVVPDRATFEDPDRAPPPPAPLLGPEHVFKANVEKEFPADRSQVSMRLRSGGPTLAAAMSDLADGRARLHEALAATGHGDALTVEGDIRTGRSGRNGASSRSDPVPRIVAEMRIDILLDGSVDVVDLFSGPGFVGIGEVERTVFGLSNPDAAFLEASRAALARVRTQAAEAGMGDWIETRADYVPAARKYQGWYNTRSIRLAVTALLHVREPRDKAGSGGGGQ